MGKNRKARGKETPKKRNWTIIYLISIILLTIGLYGNTVMNHFSMDDFYVTAGNQQTEQGLKAIPDIFSTFYATEGGQSFAYRPLVRVSFALDYELFNGIPYVSHGENVLLYLLGLILLFGVLRRLFKDRPSWIPFAITILFMAYPLHTEVVASLKNRDELLNFIFCMLALRSFLKWADLDQRKHLIFGAIFFILAILSKATALSFIFIFPLALYFFTEIPIKRLSLFGGFCLLIGVGFAAGPYLFLDDMNRIIQPWENPLVDVSWHEHLATVVYVMGFYLKKLFYPFPMLYYYGFNTIPVVGWTNPYVWLSLVPYLFMLYMAIKGTKEKKWWSFVIWVFFGLMAMYSNLLMPVPGIVGDRFLFFAALPFFIFVVLGIEQLLSIRFAFPIRKVQRIVLTFTFLCLIPYGILTVQRNAQWRTYYSLYKSDMPKLNHSVRAHYLYATEIMRTVRRELNKPVNPLKFIQHRIDTAVLHYNKLIEIYPNHATTWENLGNIYGKIDGDWEKALAHYKKSAALNSSKGRLMFNMGMAFENLNQLDSSLVYYRRALHIDPTQTTVQSRIANTLYRKGDFKAAVKMNRELMASAPESELPYLNLGNYCLNMGDTIRGISYFKEALNKAYIPDAAKVLAYYYETKNNEEQSNYYKKLYNKKGAKRF